MLNSLLADLRRVTSDHPGRERLWEQLMVALYRCGQQSEALRAFAEARALLVDEYGVEPGNGLVELERQILHHDLQAPMAAPRGATGRASVPIRPDSFVGRVREVDAIQALLAQHRLVTLTGFGGVGKTSLALEVARSISDRFPGGAHVVRLAPLTEVGVAVDALASALGIREHPTKPLLDAVVEQLADRELLVVLDNCEHLVDDAGLLAGELLTNCPSLTILATSRVPLRIAGEQVWPVPPLTTPDGRGGRPRELTIEEATASEAVALFVGRPHQHDPTFAIDESNVHDVTELCRRLDGVPLAIELAAARVRVLSPTELLERLEDRFGLLTGGNDEARHSSLASAIGWSYDLLEAHDRTLLCRLAVFEDGFTLAAAESVCGDAPLAPGEVLDVLNRLVDASLVTSRQESVTSAVSGNVCALDEFA